MKTLGLVLAMVLVVAGSSYAGSCTMDFFGSADWSLISSPQVPLESRAAYLWDNADPDAWDGWLDGNLFNFNAVTGSQDYSSYGDNAETFAVLLGQGYILHNTVSRTTMTFPAVDDGVPTGTVQTDMWISLPGMNESLAGGGAVNVDNGGWHLIGCPFAHNIPFDTTLGSFGAGDNITFTNGSEVKTWFEAARDGWVSPTMYGQDARGLFQATFDGDPAEVDLYMKPGRGYWFQTKVDNLAMIVPADAQWNPETYSW